MGRIIDYPEKTSPGSDDYLLLDSSSDGTKKIPAGNILGTGLTLDGWVNGSYVQVTSYGVVSVAESTKWNYVTYIISDALWGASLTFTTVSGSAGGYAYFDEDGNVLGSGRSGQSSIDTWECTTVIPYGAKYIKISNYNAVSAFEITTSGAMGAISSTKSALGNVVGLNGVVCTRTSGEYVTEEGSHTSSSYFNYMTIDCSDYVGMVISFTTYVSGAAGYAFCDANDTYISGGKSDNTGLAAWTESVTIPDDASYIEISSYYSYIESFSYSFETLKSYVDKCVTVSVLNNILGEKLTLVQWVNGSYVQVTSYGVVSVAESTKWNYVTYSISELLWGSTLTFTTVSSGSGGYVYTDENDNVIESGRYGVGAEGTWECTTTVPFGAKYIKVSNYNAVDSFEIEVVSAVSACVSANNAISAVVGLNQPTHTFTSGAHVSKNGVHTANSYFGYKTIDCNGYAGMTISFTTYVSGAAGYAFFDANGMYICGDASSATGTAKEWTLSVTVPVNAEYVEISCYYSYFSDFVYAFETLKGYADRRNASVINRYTIPYGNLIKTPTYDGSNEATHPKILYIEDGWNGYKYWMAITPYPRCVDDYENPQILVSNDGLTFGYFPDCPNPLFIPDDVSSGGHYSDTHLLLYGDEMYCIFRYNPANSAGTGVDNSRDIIYYTKSSNGKDWSELVTMIDTDEVFTETGGVLSPVVIYDEDDSIFKLWFSSGSHNKLYYSESATLTGFTTCTEASFNNFSIYCWHQDIIKTSKGYEALIAGFPLSDGTLNGQKLYYSVSADGVSWNQPVLIIDNYGFASKSLYRSTLIFIDDYYYVYFAGRNSSDQWSGFGLAKGASMTDLIGLDSDGNYVYDMQIGASYFDTTLNKPIWRNVFNNGWVDTSGNEITA